MTDHAPPAQCGALFWLCPSHASLSKSWSWSFYNPLLQYPNLQQTIKNFLHGQHIFSNNIFSTLDLRNPLAKKLTTEYRKIYDNIKELPKFCSSKIFLDEIHKYKELCQTQHPSATHLGCPCHICLSSWPGTLWHLMCP